MDGIRASVKAKNTVTIDISANDKDGVGVNVVWNQESITDARHYVGIEYRFNLNSRVSMRIYRHTHIRACPTETPR